MRTQEGNHTFIQLVSSRLEKRAKMPRMALIRTEKKKNRLGKQTNNNNNHNSAFNNPLAQ